MKLFKKSIASITVLAIVLTMFSSLMVFAANPAITAYLSTDNLTVPVGTTSITIDYNILFDVDADSTLYTLLTGFETTINYGATDPASLAKITPISETDSETDCTTYGEMSFVYGAQPENGLFVNEGLANGKTFSVPSTVSYNSKQGLKVFSATFKTPGLAEGDVLKFDLDGLSNFTFATTADKKTGNDAVVTKAPGISITVVDPNKAFMNNAKTALTSAITALANPVPNTVAGLPVADDLTLDAGSNAVITWTVDPTNLGVSINSATGALTRISNLGADIPGLTFTAHIVCGTETEDVDFPLVIQGMSKTNGELMDDAIAAAALITVVDDKDSYDEAVAAAQDLTDVIALGLGDGIDATKLTAAQDAKADLEALIDGFKATLKAFDLAVVSLGGGIYEYTVTPNAQWVATLGAYTSDYYVAVQVMNGTTPVGLTATKNGTTQQVFVGTNNSASISVISTVALNAASIATPYSIPVQ